MMRRSVLLATIVGLVGCTTVFEPNSIEYKSATKLPPIEVPPDLTQPTRDERYAVPDINPKSVATYSAYSADRTGATRPSTASDVLPKIDKIRVERAGSQRWLVVQEAPDKLWPVIKEFWQELGFIINLELPDAGVMETDWAENRAKIPQDFVRNTLGKVLDQLFSTAERDKFRTRIEPGSESGTTEIYISHRGVQEIYASEGRDQTVWQPRPADPELEAEMLRRLMVRLGADEKRTQAVAAAVPQVARAQLARAADGSARLTVLEPFDRAWRRVGLALDRVGFTVEDRDRAKGLYYVRYIDPTLDANAKKSEGFLSKLMFWRSDQGRPAAGQTQYRIFVRGAAAGSEIQVLSREGGVDKSETSNRILSLLHEQLK
ncbi:MAG: hypothetical protein IOMNBAOH_02410 [Rhodocyclaceae bacterium]|nr:hypothetical protein [Rhodocyclaceae bacterium]